MNIRNILFPILIILLILGSPSSYSEEEQLHNLPLNCHAIPGNKDKLCTALTQTSYGPFEDAVIYRLDENNELSLLRIRSGGVGVFAGFGFSEGGRIMWESWAEEGHPSFSFYLTNDYLLAGQKISSVGVIGDYYFDHFVQFTDQGMVSYAVINDSSIPCIVTRYKGKKLPSGINSPNGEIQYCLKYLFLS